MTGAAEGKIHLGTALPLRQILAENASPMTGPGTTTYLLGRGEVTVIDPGPDDPAHLQAILAALEPQERVAAILVTHPHLDHSALVPALARQTGAEVMGYGPPGSGMNARMADLTALGLPQGSEGLDHGFAPDRALRGGERLRIGALTLEVIHTPGHMAEHLGFALGDQLFCGDHVMAWAPSLVSPPEGDMRDYLASLEALAGRDWGCLWPSHGAPITAPARRIAELLAHRRGREAQILAALEAGPARIDMLTARIYHDVDPRLWPAAARNLLAHLIDLRERGQVQASYWPARDSLFSLA